MASARDEEKEPKDNRMTVVDTGMLLELGLADVSDGDDADDDDAVMKGKKNTNNTKK